MRQKRLLALVSVVSVLVTSCAVAPEGRGVPGEEHRPPSTVAASPTSSRVPDRAASAGDALRDPLTYRLTLTGLRPNGTVGSRITVTNASDRLVVDPGCRHVANFRYGVVPVDRPGDPLQGSMITRCAGPQDLPPGFRSTFAGPRFDAGALPASDYLAVIDFLDAGSERLTAPLTVSAPDEDRG